MVLRRPSPAWTHRLAAAWTHRLALAAGLAGCTTAYQLDPEAVATLRAQREPPPAVAQPAGAAPAPQAAPLAAPLAAMDGERHTWLPAESVLDVANPETGVAELYDERHAIRGWGYGFTAVGSLGLLTQITFAATGSEFTNDAWPWAVSGSALAVGVGLLVWALYSDGPEVAAPPPVPDEPPVLHQQR